MKRRNIHRRAVYAFVFVAILIIELPIALLIKDDFIMSYGGDVLVTALICYAVGCISFYVCEKIVIKNKSICMNRKGFKQMFLYIYALSCQYSS